MILIEVMQAALMEYQTKRGGRVVLQNITKPTVMEWGTALEAMAAVFDMEKAVRSKWRKIRRKEKRHWKRWKRRRWRMWRNIYRG